jgi:hypothetical protein
MEKARHNGTSHPIIPMLNLVLASTSIQHFSSEVGSFLFFFFFFSLYCLEQHETTTRTTTTTPHHNQLEED